MALFFICLVITISFVDSTSDDCQNIRCSRVYDPVCGAATALGGTVTVNRYHNECYLNKIRCLLKSVMDINQIDDSVCNIEKELILVTRRVADFTIVGAREACNHTCPTYCVDTYEPACAQIFKTEFKSDYKPMINHCHIDLFSCVMGLNVTIRPLSSCYKNPSGLLFMTQMAAIKAMGMLGD